MDRVSTTGRGAGRRGRLAGIAGASVVALMALSACTSQSGTHNSQQTDQAGSAPASVGGSSSATSSAPADPAVFTTNFTSKKNISPSEPVKVDIAHGKLTGVKMTNPSGRVVSGALSSSGTSWQSTEDLGYSRTYKITATGTDMSGKTVTKQTSVRTVSPDNMTMPYLYRIGNYPLGNNETYGVAIVPVVHFDEPITHKRAAEKALSVTTSPHVDGAWYWADDQDVHWRPRNYWPSGTKVTVSAKVYGVEVGRGLYGQSDVSTSFKIGRRQTTIAWDTAPRSVNKVKVYNDKGKVIRTMHTSMGEHSGETVNGQYINFYTLDGTYTVLAHEQPAKMCSASYGLPANAPGGYACEDIYNATKISTDGIYLHELLTTIWAQESGQDVSHGCLNLNAANSLWFFNHSMIGDPVQIHGNKHAPTLQVGEGGDWTVPWSQWVKGGANT